MLAATNDPAVVPSLPSMGRAPQLGPAQPVLAKVGGVKPCTQTVRPPHPRPGRHLIHDLYSLLTELGTIPPDSNLPPAALAVANRLIIRGARHLAHAPGSLRVKPFAPGRPWPRKSVGLALLKLTAAIDHRAFRYKGAAVSTAALMVSPSW